MGACVCAREHVLVNTCLYVFMHVCVPRTSKVHCCQIKGEFLSLTFKDLCRMAPVFLWGLPSLSGDAYFFLYFSLLNVLL